jgi:hypothetical protein
LKRFTNEKSFQLHGSHSHKNTNFKEKFFF